MIASKSVIYLSSIPEPENRIYLKSEMNKKWKWLKRDFRNANNCFSYNINKYIVTLLLPNV